MVSLSTHLAKSFLQSVQCRHSFFARSSISAVNLGRRRWQSGSTSSVSAESLVGLHEASGPIKKMGRPPKPKPPVDENEPKKKLGRPRTRPQEDPDAPRRSKGRPRKDSNDPPIEKGDHEILDTVEGDSETLKKENATEVFEERTVSPRKRRTSKMREESTEGNEGSPKRLGRPKGDGTKPSAIPRPQRPQKIVVNPLDALSSPMQLPPPETWAHYYPYKREWVHRTTLSNLDSARKLAEIFVPEGSKDKIIIEASPGPGQLSRALLALPKERIKKLIIIEDAETFMSTLQVLEQADPRVVVISKPGKQWTTYIEMEADGLLDDAKEFSWEEENDQLQFIMTIPTDVYGEQLVSQLMRAVPDRQWLFKYGRVPMNFLMTTRMWDRISAPIHSVPRCKVSAMADAVSTFSQVLPLEPHWDHFYPTRFGQPLNIQMTATTVVPKAHQIISSGELDLWDYCLRKLFVLRATPISGALFTLGAGGANLLSKLTDPSLPVDQRIDPTKTPRDLDMHDWTLLVQAFKAWPFRPMDLSIESHLNRHDK